VLDWMAQPESSADPVVELRDQKVPLSTLCGLLWNCVDTLPGDVFDELQGCAHPPDSRSYAAAARWLRRQNAR
jgi:hypothetical protein